MDIAAVMQLCWSWVNWYTEAEKLRETLQYTHMLSQNCMAVSLLVSCRSPTAAAS